VATNYAEPVNLVEDLVPLSLDAPNETPTPIAVKYPPAWCTRYFERKYYRIDPTLIHAPSFARPYLWRDLRNVRSRPASAFVLAGSVRVRPPSRRKRSYPSTLGKVAVVSFASDASDIRPSASSAIWERLPLTSTRCLQLWRGVGTVCCSRPAHGTRARVSAMECTRQDILDIGVILASAKARPHSI